MFCLQASSAYKHSLKEVLTLPAIASKIKDTKAAREVAALQVGVARLLTKHGSTRTTLEDCVSKQ